MAVVVWVGLLLVNIVPAARAESLEALLPAGFPPPVVPKNNPWTEAKAELGRYLFFDSRLSADGTFSCATCHQPAHAFTDSRPRAIGVTGEVHPRGAMSLVNVAFNASLNWADPITRRLEAQMVIPMFSVSPVEMGLAGHEEEVLARLLGVSRYGPLFERAFPDHPDPISMQNIILAIASFERTLISGNSPYDRYVYWDERGSFSAPARRGMELFFSDELRCSVCHSGFNLSGPVIYREGAETKPVFHNTALYDIDGQGAYPQDNEGVLTHTGDPTDMGELPGADPEKHRLDGTLHARRESSDPGRGHCPLRCRWESSGESLEERASRGLRDLRFASRGSGRISGELDG